jgi:hypothetical protein
VRFRALTNWWDVFTGTWMTEINARLVNAWPDITQKCSRNWMNG